MEGLLQAMGILCSKDEIDLDAMEADLEAIMDGPMEIEESSADLEAAPTQANVVDPFKGFLRVSADGEILSDEEARNKG